MIAVQPLLCRFILVAATVATILLVVVARPSYAQVQKNPGGDDERSAAATSVYQSMDDAAQMDVDEMKYALAWHEVNLAIRRQRVDCSLAKLAMFEARRAQLKPGEAKNTASRLDSMIHLHAQKLKLRRLEVKQAELVLERFKYTLETIGIAPSQIREKASN